MQARQWAGMPGQPGTAAAALATGAMSGGWGQLGMVWLRVQVLPSPAKAFEKKGVSRRPVFGYTKLASLSYL